MFTVYLKKIILCLKNVHHVLEKIFKKYLACMQKKINVYLENG